MTAVIERISPVPYYEQLFAILRDRITTGEIAAEERLPSELELCRDYGLSRATVRQTLVKLETEGFARRVPRRGVFASAPGEASGWTVQEGFLESQIRFGRNGVETNVVDARFIVPPQHASEALGTAEGESVFALQRVRSVDGRLAMFSVNWFPKNTSGSVISTASDVLAGAGSVNAALRHSGYVPTGAHRVIRAMRAPETVAAHLQIDSDLPVLRVRSLSWDKTEARFDYYETWVLTDVVPLEVNVAVS